MAKAFTLASWNVEHFKKDAARIERVIQFLETQDPDVFGLFEVEGKEVFSALVTKMPDYQFHITEGPQVQEILVGVKSGITAFFTQKAEFKAQIPTLRPGALLTITVDGVHYPILFLHTKSLSTPLGLGIRDDQFDRAFNFKKYLDGTAGGEGKSNFIFLGDLNVMGMKYPFEKSIEPPIEIQKLDKDAAKAKMRRLTKNNPTWWNGPGSKYKPADLDQVIACEHLKFKQIGGADIDVRGWPKLGTPAQQGDWIKQYSDHGLLYLEVEKL
jgi:exonuclease III